MTGMIIEAFSIVLQRPENRDRIPERVLYDWLVQILLVPPSPEDHVAKILHTEVELLNHEGGYNFEGRSESGNRLLVALFNYCRSYDQWQFSRFVHHINASDFTVGLL